MHIQLNWHQDENTLKAEENWTWSEKKIQGAAAKETLQGAGRVSSSWESFQRKAEREKMWRAGKQVKARQRKYKELAKGKKESCKICCQSH